jgi:DNA replication and repair protein RecF
MHLKTLRIEDLRLIERLELPLDARWNLLLGPNGAGKTTVLEAAYLLSHGRSFRSGGRDALSRHGSGGYSVFGESIRGDTTERVGVASGGRKLEARLDGASVAIGDLLRHTAVLCFEPGSHELIAGPAEERRRFLDWGVFHVEPDFLPVWRRYQRALRQRNVLLRLQRAAELDPWDTELSLAAEPLLAMRQRYFDALRPHALATLDELLPELGIVELQYSPGFDAQQSLATVLELRRERDLARGHSSAGPHRADWSVTFAAAPRREHLSRGQEKLCAFSLVMAQARLFAEYSGEWPVLCLDDLASEVDRAHQGLVIAAVDASGAQVLATGTEEPAGLARMNTSITRFHVEQGRVTRLL